MSSLPRLEPKYGVDRTFSRYADSGCRLQLCQWREEAHDCASCQPPSRSSSMTDRRKEGDGTEDYRGEGSRHRPSATTRPKCSPRTGLHDLQPELIRRGNE